MNSKEMAAVNKTLGKLGITNFSSLNPLPENPNLYSVVINDKVGIIDSVKAEIVMPVIFENLRKLVGDLYQVWSRDSKIGIFCILTRKLIVPTICRDITGRGYNLYELVRIIHNRRVEGLFTTVGNKVLLKAEFKEVRPHRGEVYTVTDWNNRCGLYHTKLERFLVPVKFEGARISGIPGFCVICNKSKKRQGLWSISDQKIVIPVKYDYFNVVDTKNDMWTVGYENGLKGVYSISKGMLLVPVSFTSIEKINNDKFIVGYPGSRGTLYGVYSVSGQKLIVPIEYNEIKVIGRKLSMKKTVVDKFDLS